MMASGPAPSQTPYIVRFAMSARTKLLTRSAKKVKVEIGAFISVICSWCYLEDVMLVGGKLQKMYSKTGSEG